MAAPAAAVVRLPVATSKVRLSYCVETCSMPGCCYTGAVKLLITQGGVICMCVLALHMCVSTVPTVAQPISSKVGKTVFRDLVGQTVVVLVEQ